MLSKIKMFGFFVAALLVTCLLSWPSPANASGGGAGFNGNEQEEAKGTTSKPPQATAAPAQQKSASDLKKEGIELYHSGNYNRAIETFKQMEGRTQDKSLLAQAYIYLSMSYYCLEEQEEAKKWLKKAVETNPEINEADLLFPPGFDTLYNETRGTTSKSPQTKVVTQDKIQVADTASGTGGTKKKASALRLKLYGGFSRLSAGDVNDGADGYFEILELLEASSGGSTSGGYRPLNSGINVGADIIFQLTPNIGVGIGAGYLQGSKTSQMTLSAEGIEYNLTGTPKLSAMPIRLAAFFTLPLGEKLSITADAGAAIYAGLKFDARQRLELSNATDSMWTEMSLKASRTSLSGNLGFQGSLGIDYAFSQNMGFFVEAAFRYANFKNFDSATGITENDDGSGGTDEGKIYLETNTYAGMGTWSTFIVSEEPPTPDEYSDYREPKFNLSGISLQAGIRIRF
ncbi:MAG: tetratricopeptide repeat protein [Candidatus Aminicenantes bacterium]|nr:tetratricopeptide repeat protein [Candidatus Aminicenantes bacterium]